MRSLFVAAVLTVALFLAGCGLQSVDSSNALTLHVRNDTLGIVTMETPGVPGSVILAKHEGIYESAWSNSQPGVAVIRILEGRDGGKVLGCLNVHYRKGQERAFALVTAATSCAAATHNGASVWVGVAVIAAAVLALLVLFVTRPSRIPAEWRVPVAFAVLWVVPLVVAVARPSWWERIHGQANDFGTAFSLALVIVLVGALLSRSRLAWWVLVVLYLAGFGTWIQRLVSQGLGTAWTLWGVLALVNFALLVSAPMRRFVRFRGRLAPGPR